MKVDVFCLKDLAKVSRKILTILREPEIYRKRFSNLKPAKNDLSTYFECLWMKYLDMHPCVYRVIDHWYWTENKAGTLNVEKVMETLPDKMRKYHKTTPSRNLNVYYLSKPPMSVIIYKGKLMILDSTMSMKTNLEMYKDITPNYCRALQSKIGRVEYKIEVNKTALDNVSINKAWYYHRLGFKITLHIEHRAMEPQIICAIKQITLAIGTTTVTCRRDGTFDLINRCQCHVNYDDWDTM